MEVINTDIEGVVIIQPKVFGDHRGYFFESFLYKSPIPHIPKYARVREEIRNSVKHRTGVGASVVNKI